MRIRFQDGKTKVLTLSYDDGVIHDRRLMEIMDRNGLKGTFNLNSGLYCSEESERADGDVRLKLSEAQELFRNSGHEVAVHGYSHPFFEQLFSDEAVLEVMRDRENLEEQFETIVKGMAYPWGTYSDEVVEILKKCGIVYARTTVSSGDFRLPTDWLRWEATCHHNDSRLMDLAKQFRDETPPWGGVWLFYLWGHSYEFDANQNWDVIEKFASYLGGREDIWYATNMEIYRYVKAYEALETNAEKTLIYNPTALDVWAEIRGNIVKIPAGETCRVN